MAEKYKPAGRVLRNVHHGQFYEGTDPAPPSTRFDYLFERLAKEFPAHHLPGDAEAVTVSLKELGEALIEAPPQDGDELEATGNSPIPTVYTYWGQFIDHDTTAGTDRNTVADITLARLEAIDPVVVVQDLKNLREPTLNLDSMYGDGPSFDGQPATVASSQFDGIRMRLSEVAQTNDDGSTPPGDQIPPLADVERDLPRDRESGAALISDGRNDENLIVAQFHVAFLRFHNEILKWAITHHPKEGDRERFERVRNLVRWHYQWLVVHDYLKTVTVPGVVDKVLLGGNRHFEPRSGEAYMPLEYSVAAYRFGHSMVRGAYDYNRNFGLPGAVIPFAPFGLIFAFTGSARENGEPKPFRGDTKVLPFNWVIEWDRFVDKGDIEPSHFARKIDTRLAPPLFDMTNQVSQEDEGRPEAIKDILKRLAVRNLLRGYQLSLPTGQAVATVLDVAPLTEEELQRGNSDEVNAALSKGGFLQATPLWFYVLKEAEVRANGNFLGEVGSRIVAETLIGQLRNDPESYLNQEGGWDPAMGMRLPDDELIVTIKDLFRFAGVLPTVRAGAAGG